jgi:hypothetical protein
MEKLTLTVGRIALFLGGAAALLTAFSLIKPFFLVVLLALFSGLLGFMTSSVYIILNLRFQVNTRKMTPGLIGLFLSSLPVLYILILKATH